MLLNDRFVDILVRKDLGDAVRLKGGSYLLDVNNKIVIIGGSFKNPVIHYVIVINAENATDAQEIKEVVFKHEHLKSLTSREASSGIGIYETYFGQKNVREYDSKDFGYNAQAANLYARLPDGFRSYGYTQQQQDGSGVSAEAEETGTAKRLRFSKGTATVEAEEAEQTEQRTPPSADARLMGEHMARMDEEARYSSKLPRSMLGFHSTNAENATVAAKYKEVILDADYFTGKPAKMAGFYCDIIASHELTRNIYGYHRTDFNNVETAKKGAERYAIAPTGFKSYGYTQQQQDGSGVSAEDEETGTAKGLSYSKGTAKLFAEMRIIPSLQEIITFSYVNWHSPDHKEHKLFRERGFDNYRGKLRIDNVIFSYVVRVGKARFGDVFYDIKLEVDSILPHVKDASEIHESTSSNTKISQNDSGVNNYSVRKSKKRFRKFALFQRHRHCGNGGSGRATHAAFGRCPPDLSA